VCEKFLQCRARKHRELEQPRASGGSRKSYLYGGEFSPDKKAAYRNFFPRKKREFEPYIDSLVSWSIALGDKSSLFHSP
jgi:hypothetical protein